MDIHVRVMVHKFLLNLSSRVLSHTDLSARAICFTQLRSDAQMPHGIGVGTVAFRAMLQKDNSIDVATTTLDTLN